MLGCMVAGFAFVIIGVAVIFIGMAVSKNLSKGDTTNGKKRRS